MDDKRQNDQLEPRFSSSVPIQDEPLKTSRERWMIETGGERMSGRSVLAAWHDDDDDDHKMNARTGKTEWRWFIENFATNWNITKPKSVREIWTYGIMMNFEIQTDHHIQARWPHSVLITKKNGICHQLQGKLQCRFIYFNDILSSSQIILCRHVSITAFVVHYIYV